MEERTAFLDLLSREINSGSNKFNFDSLNVYLTEAIQSLPDGNLKDVLLKETGENSEYLWSCLKSSKKNTSSVILFNIFNKDGLDETLESITALKSSKEQLFYLSQVALCVPSEDVFDSLLNVKVASKTNQSKLQIFVNVVEICVRLTVGCKNLKVLHGLMRFFLRELANVYEDLNLKDRPDESSWVMLKDVVLGFLVHCHLKRKKQKENDHVDGSRTNLKEYRDLLAAILSLYIDILVVISKWVDSSLNQVSNVIYNLLGDSPSHILDTVNQVSPLDEKSIQTLLPFLRKVLCSTRDCCTEFINYIKYISAARKVLKLIDNREENHAFAIKKIVTAIVSPDGLVRWISERNDSVVEDLNLPGLPEKKITKHLLKFSCDETMENLLDLVVGETEERQSFKNTLQDNVEDETNLDDALFFLDSKGSSELLEQCEVEELTNTKSDRIIKRQIDAILEKLEASSEEVEENDDFDLSFEEVDAGQGNPGFIKEEDVEKIVDSLVESGCTKDVAELEDKSDDITIQFEDILDDSLDKSGGEKRKKKRKSETMKKTKKEITKRKSKKKI